jgi:L-alanine-DL-glutamate epimerase-like enolase superfamily enzyme
MKLLLDIELRTWPMREPFVIARGVQTEFETLIATLADEDGHQGRGEAAGVAYACETPATMAAEIEGVRDAIEEGMDRESLLEILPPGGARFAIDAALWDLEAKQTGCTAFELAGNPSPSPVTSAYTIGIRPIADYESAAAARADYPVLKIKVDSHDPVAAVEAVRRGAPNAALIVDPNQSWTTDMLQQLAPAMHSLGVVLLEQPIKVGAEAELDGYACPVPLCADELINDASDLAKAVDRFDVVNIKLDKTGGLTAALRLADEAVGKGFSLMVGCMGGPSLCMAPGLVLAQICSFIDLDGPLLLAADWSDGLRYRNGVVSMPSRRLWG